MFFEAPSIDRDVREALHVSCDRHVTIVPSSHRIVGEAMRHSLIVFGVIVVVGVVVVVDRTRHVSYTATMLSVMSSLSTTLSATALCRQQSNTGT